MVKVPEENVFVHHYLQALFESSSVESLKGLFHEFYCLRTFLPCQKVESVAGKEVLEALARIEELRSVLRDRRVEHQNFGLDAPDIVGDEIGVLLQVQQPIESVEED